MQQFDDLLASLDVSLSQAVLDRIDEIVPPGTDVGQLQMAYNPPSVTNSALRRRAIGARTAS